MLGVIELSLGNEGNTWKNNQRVTSTPNVPGKTAVFLGMDQPTSGCGKLQRGGGGDSSRNRQLQKVNITQKSRPTERCVCS
jgi:hypothetical protein